MMIIVWIIVALLAICIIWLIASYNGFIRLRTNAEEAWADIDVQLKRRYDLIPNLVESVKGYASHEREAFDRVTNARAKALSAEQGGNPHEIAKAENMLTGALKSVFAVAEAYPDLKANQNFLQLQNELADTENKIQAARRFYNSNVKELNTKIETVPSNIVAGLFHFTKREFFDLDESPEAKEPVKVSF